MLKLQARLAGPTALQALQEVSGWTVLQVHAQACNLVAEPDHLLALVTPKVGPGPFSLVVELPKKKGGLTDYLQEGETGESDTESLAFATIRVDLSAAVSWQPRPPWEALRASGRLADKLDEIAALLKVHAPPGSLAEGLEEMLQEPQETSGSGPTGADLKESRGPGDEAVDKAEGPGELAVERAAHAAARRDLASAALATVVSAGRRLFQALGEGDLQGASAAAGELAGLGTGLTPAGDDFLMGAMLAVWSVAEPTWAERASRALLEAATPRTHRISRAWLRAAAAGEAAEPWHSLVRALIGGRQRPLRQAVGRIARQGHTSGADTLTGFVVTANKTAPVTGAA